MNEAAIPKDVSATQPWSEKGKAPWAVVACVDTLNGIQTVRLLARKDIRVVGLISDPHNPYGRTRLCEKVLVADPEGPELVSTLLHLGPQFSAKPVLYPVNDPVVGLVSRHREELADYYHIVLPPTDIVDMMLSKDAFYAYAEEHDLPIPRTVTVEGPDDLKRAIESLTFPCIVKPQRRLAIWHQFTKYKGVKVADTSELQALYNACHQKVGTVIVQEWIVGSSADLYSCNLYMDANSDPLATFVARKLRQWPPDVGSSSSGEECHNEKVLKLAVDLFRSTRCRGLAYLEVKRDVRTGRHVIIEPNIGRPTGRSPIAEAGGVELIYTMYCDALGLPLPPNRKQTYGGVKWIYLRWDIQSALVHLWRRELTFGDWYQSFRGKKAYALFSWNDPGPFIWDLWATTVKAASTLLFPRRKPRSKVNF